ncbi:hypothetical protein ACWDWO_25800 [Actinopolymorpha singaporensis]
MAPQNKHTRHLIEAAAQAAADKAGPHLNVAVDYVDKYTKLPWHAFGALPATILAGSYDAARESQLHNLRDGREKLRQMVEGLAQVAHTYWTAEKANTLTADGKEKLEATRPKPATSLLGSIVDGYAAGGVPLTVVAAVALRPHWVFSIVTKNATARLCPLALISVGTWAALEPDEESLSQAKGAWEQTAEHLKNIGDLDTAMGLSEDAWSVENDSRRQFNAWLADFQVELNDAKDAASSQATAIDGVVSAIRGIQTGMVITDAACLAAMICFKIMEAFPLTTLAGKLGQVAVAITNAIATTAVAAAILSFITTWAGNATSIASAGQFKKLEIGPGGDEQTFIDLKDPTEDWAKA